MAESGKSPGLSLSTYNRQHGLAYDANGEQYDPLVRDIAKYRALFANPHTIDDRFIQDLPLSVGLLRSFAVSELGMENAHGLFYDLERRCRVENFTNVFDYAEGIREMKEVIQARRAPQGQGPSDGGPGAPPTNTSFGIRQNFGFLNG